MFLHFLYTNSLGNDCVEYSFCKNNSNQLYTLSYKQYEYDKYCWKIDINNNDV